MAATGSKVGGSVSSLAWGNDRSLVHRFTRRAHESGGRVALRYRPERGWAELTWQEWYAAARHVAAAMVTLGVRPGDRVAIWARTRVEWVIADIGSWMAGAVTVPVYAASTEEQVAYILADCGASWIICEDAAQLSKVAAKRGELASLARAVCILPDPLVEPESHDGWAMSWRQLEALGAERAVTTAKNIDERTSALGPDTLATIAYTSGTNGDPKGVRLTHGSLMYSTEVSVEPLGISSADTQLLFLPLAHIVGRQLVASSFVSGCVTALDPDPLSVLSNCRELAVTYFCGVPRLLEKLYASFNGAPANRLREALGGQMRFILSGGASLPLAVTEFFRGAGVPVYEGYGLTETAGTLTINLPGRCRDGSVGQVAAGTKLRIAEDGEILAHGPGVMAGYHERPDEDDAVLLRLEGQSWLCTGDIGHIDADGYLWITDRKKDLIKLSTGKYVAPQPVENLLKASSGLLSQAVVYGEGRAYVTALCTLSPDAITELLAKLRIDSPSELCRSADVAERIEQVIQVVNERLAPHERVRRFAVVYPDFALDTGDLTPTLKLRRQVIVTKHRAVLDALYVGA